MSQGNTGMDRRDFFRRAGVGAAVLGMGLTSESALAKRVVQKADPHAPKTGRTRGWRQQPKGTGVNSQQVAIHL